MALFLVLVALSAGHVVATSPTDAQAASPPARPASPSAIGACCLPDESCVLLDELDCGAQGGEFAGEGTSCSPTPCLGACCVPTGGCDMLTESECASQDGDFFGYFFECNPVLCDWGGVCCFPEGCQWLVNDACGGAGGYYLGAEGRCEWCRGACCLPDGTCLWVFEAECDAEGGAFEGLFSECSPESCASADVPETRAGAALTLRIFPNPARSRVTVAFRAPSAAPARIQVVDSSGRIAWRSSVEGGIGSREATVPVGAESESSVPAGVYYVLVSVGEAHASGRLVVNR
ncbi:MAG: T9SS type A sorting domain-containing protein [Candidatus Eisenbacteria bacterium]